MNKRRLPAVAAAGSVAALLLWNVLPLPGPGATTDSAHGFVAKIEVGVPGATDARSCSGALVRPAWVLTSAECFARNGVPARDGLPLLRTTVTVGRPDLASGAGHTLAATRIVVHPDRDVALVRLVAAATGVAPVELSATAPAQGETLRIAGYGRTGAAWAPARQHSGDFTVESVPVGAPIQLAATAGATVCEGDAGGPVLRESAGRQALVGLAAGSGRAGCPGAEAGALTGAAGVPAGDLDAWIRAAEQRTTLPVMSAGDAELGSGRWADLDGDGRDDYLVIDATGEVDAYLNRGGGAGGWVFRETVAAGGTSDMRRARFADFNGDGKDDYVLFDTDGTFSVSLNKGGNGAGGWEWKGRVADGATGDMSRVHFADLDRDGRDDYIWVNDKGSFSAYLNTAKGWLERADFSSTQGLAMNRLRFADYDGDGRDDLLYFKEGSGAFFVELNRVTGWVTLGQVAGGATGDVNRARFADYDGDGRSDYLYYDTAGGLYGVLNLDGAGSWQAVPRSQ